MPNPTMGDTTLVERLRCRGGLYVEAADEIERLLATQESKTVTEDEIAQVMNDTMYDVDYRVWQQWTSRNNFACRSMARAVVALLRGRKTPPVVTEEEIESLYREIYQANGSTLNCGWAVRNVLLNALLRERTAPTVADMTPAERAAMERATRELQNEFDALKADKKRGEGNAG